MENNRSDLKLLGILKSIDDSEDGKIAREKLFLELQRQSSRSHLHGRRTENSAYVRTRVRAGIAG